MLGEEERSQEEGSFSKAKIPKRIAVVLSGGLVNIVFGLLVYFILVSTSGNYISTTIDSIKPEYAAGQSGIQVNDKILKINGKVVRLKSNIDTAIQKSNGSEMKITIEREGKTEELKLAPTEEINKAIGIYFGVEGENLTSKISGIYQNSPAEKEGLKAGDIIKKVDGIECNNNPYKTVDLISTNSDEQIKIEIEREGEIRTFDIYPETQKTYKLGVAFKLVENTFINNIYYGFWDTLDFSISIVDNIKMLFTGKVNADQLMGPIGISEVVSKTKDLTEFIYMLALISLSLGVTNLLPFAPLDGGKVVLLIIEAIRRKPLKENIEVGIQMAGFCLLIGLSIYVTYNDILRIF